MFLVAHSQHRPLAALFSITRRGMQRLSDPSHLILSIHLISHKACLSHPPDPNILSRPPMSGACFCLGQAYLGTVFMSCPEE